MSSDQLDLLVQQAQQFILTGSWISVVIFLICGLALTYAGLKIYWLGLFLSGMVFGALLGAGIGAVAGASDGGLVIVVLVSAFICGCLSVIAVGIAVFLLGMFAGSLLAMACGAKEPVIVLIIAVICGALAAVLYHFAIIISTAASGSVLLSWAVINGLSLAQYRSIAYLSSSPVGYGLRLGKSALASGSMDSLFHRASGDLLLFFFFFSTGVIFQLNFDRILGALFKQAVQDRPRLQSPVHVKRDLLEVVGQQPRIVEYQPVTVEKLVVPRSSETPPEKPSTPGSWMVALFEEGRMLLQQKLDPGEYIIGRGAEVEFQLKDPALSRKHLLLRISDEHHLMLKDLGSANGTWRLGTERVELEQPHNGDWYQVGRAQVLLKRLLE